MNADAATEAARAKLPLKRILEQRGSGPRNAGEKWTDFTCPFCNKRGAGVHSKAGIDLFKCWHTSCPSGSNGDGMSKDEAGLIALFGSTSRKDGWMAWLKEAGVWKDEPYGPSVMPGTRARKKKPILESAQRERLSVEPAGISSAPTDASQRPSPPEAGVIPPEPQAPPPQVDCPPPREAGSSGPPAPTPAPDNGAGPFAEEPPAASETPSSPDEAGDPPGSGVGRGGGRGRGAGDPPGEGGSPQPRDGSLDALRLFYERISLSPDHRAALAQKRGLTDASIDRFGFRSSTRSNRAVIEGLQSECSTEDLLAAGLLVDGDGGPKVNAQFCGWGVVGKKKSAPDEESEFEWDWCDPVLIPYWNPAGELVFLRPHKGMGRKGTPSGVPRLFVARGAGESESSRKLAVICEGELKACALQQTLPGIAVGSLPGITMAKFPPIQQQLLRWLRGSGAKRVVVVFDNEEKSDPALPGYKEDPAKRYEADVWARFLARWLKAKGFKALVGRLPDDWRDASGKADWDGALAAFQSGRIQGDPVTAFQAVIDAAVSAEDTEQLALFAGQQQEQIIRNRLVRLEYEPLLPFGGDLEIDIARRLERAAADRDWAESGRCWKLARQFRDVVGWYYRRAPVKWDKQDKAVMLVRRAELERVVEVANWDAMDAGARRMLQTARDRLEFYRQLELGPPDGVADFKLDVKFAIVKPNSDRELLVRIHNRIKTTTAVLDQHSFTAPRDFKEWCAMKGPYTWMTGETELELLRHDINQLSAFREVHAVACFGWHAASKLWFSGDCAIAPDGTKLLPDVDGVIWYNGLGYRMGNVDWEGEAFALGRPLWHPNKGLKWSADKGLFLEDGEDDVEALRELAASLCSALMDTLGGPEGMMVLGATIAFVCGPEFFASEKWFPGLWIHGERGSGKTMLARWLMRIYGFDLEGGVSLPNCTRVGMQLAAQQYCNLPVWLEEYQSTLDHAKVEMVKSLYNREPALKKEFGDQRRKIVTNAIITGESTASDSATRQRFPHAQVSDKRRRGNTQGWFEENSPFFFTLGRFLLRHRAAFVAEFYPRWRRWVTAPELRAADERSKQVYGVSIAAIEALNVVLGGLPAPMIEGLNQWGVTQIGQSVLDVRADVKVNIFWNYVAEGFKMGWFGHGNEILKFFKARKTVLPAPPKAPHQIQDNARPWIPLKWDSWELFFQIGPIYLRLEQELSKIRKIMPLSRQDLRDQMSKYDYWVPGKLRHRFGDGAVSTCWAVRLDYHPMGYQDVSDDELEEARRMSSDDSGAREEFSDPRMSGDLYRIALACERARTRGDE